MIRESWIGEHDEISQVRQCSLAGVSRATVYAHQKPVPIDLEDLMLSALIDEEYTRHPFYGSRRMVVFLVRLGHDIKRRGVQKLMRAMGLVGMAPGPNTSRAHPEHKVYPYLLRGVPVVRPIKSGVQTSHTSASLMGSPIWWPSLIGIHVGC